MGGDDDVGGGGRDQTKNSAQLADWLAGSAFIFWGRA